ncbi:MAG: hypothetical protein O3C68_04170 [Proteobacteria bacterium]|nr:hypothetical protein [Pseudomonadota bacterium]
MPIETIQDSGEHFAVQRVTDALVVEEVLAAQKQLYLSPDHNAHRPVLWDTRAADIKTSFGDILKMVDGSTGLWQKMAGGRSAILVAEREHAMQGRLYKLLAAAMPRELQVFTSYHEAETWLNATVQSMAPNAS